MSEETITSNSSIPQQPEASQTSAAATDQESGMMQELPPEIRIRPRRRKKVSYLTIQKIKSVDYKDVNLLKRFLNEFGKIVPARQSGNTAHQQRMVTRAIKRAREMALLPFVPKDGMFERFGFKSNRTPRDRAPRQYSKDTSSQETQS